jgi:hypothetical protein
MGILSNQSFSLSPKLAKINNIKFNNQYTKLFSKLVFIILYFNLNIFIMKNIKETIIGVFAVIGFVVIASGFSTNNAAQEQQTIFEFETVTVIDSHIQGGLGRSRMISGTVAIDYKESTTIRLEDGKKIKSDKKRSEIRTKAFEETKLLNFYNVAGIRFNNVATNDALVKSKLNEMSNQGWELFTVVAGVESADKERDAIFITRYIFKRPV